jgi:hypothetical protein
MNEDKFEQNLRHFFQAEVKKAEPPGTWWDNAFSMLESPKQPSKTTQKPTRKWRLHPSLIGIPLSIVLLITVVGSLLASMGGMAPPPPAAPITISDGTSGAFLVWHDQPYRQYKATIRAQHIDKNGNLLWSTEGFQITGDGVRPPQAISDGSGGLIIAWSHDKGSNITRLSPDGNSVWLLENIPSRSLLAMAEDISGGALLLFSRDDVLHALRISNDGLFSWGQEGIVVGIAEYPHRGVSITSDGCGGTVVIWQDGIDTSVRILAQRISSQGKILWTDGGVVLTTIPNSFGNVVHTHVITDRMGNIFVAWDTETTMSGALDNDVYVQKLDSDGNKQWGEAGIPPCRDKGVDPYGPSNIQSHPQMAPDGEGGVIVTWHDRRRIFNREIFAQRINSAGEIMWDANGIWLWDIPSDYPKTSGILDSCVIDDGTGGAIILWTGHGEYRNYTTFIQKLDNDGERQWSNEIVYSNPAFQSQGYSSITSDGQGGVIVGSRTGESSSLSQTDSVYAQRISADGAQMWNESGVEIHKVPTAKTVILVTIVALLTAIPVFVGVLRDNKIARVLTAILPVLLGIAGLFSLFLVTGFLGSTYSWAYTPDTVINKLLTVLVPFTGMVIATVGIRRKAVTKWVMVPVLVFCVLITAISGILLIG